MNTCPVCRTENDDSAKFCRSCGTALAGAPAAYAPRVTTRDEFLALPENQHFKKEIRSAAIICYISVAATVALAFLDNKFILIDAAIMLAIALGIHLRQSRVCAVLLLVYALINTVMRLVQTGRFGGYLILLAGVYAVISTFKLEKQWKEYRNFGRNGM